MNLNISLPVFTQIFGPEIFLSDQNILSLSKDLLKNIGKRTVSSSLKKQFKI